jgi:hypothetical protein
MNSVAHSNEKNQLPIGLFAAVPALAAAPLLRRRMKELVVVQKNAGKNQNQGRRPLPLPPTSRSTYLKAIQVKLTEELKGLTLIVAAPKKQQGFTEQQKSILKDLLDRHKKKVRVLSVLVGSIDEIVSLLPTGTGHDRMIDSKFINQSNGSLLTPLIIVYYRNRLVKIFAWPENLMSADHLWKTYIDDSRLKNAMEKEYRTTHAVKNLLALVTDKYWIVFYHGNPTIPKYEERNRAYKKLFTTIQSEYKNKNAPFKYIEIPWRTDEYRQAIHMSVMKAASMNIKLNSELQVPPDLPTIVVYKKQRPVYLHHASDSNSHRNALMKYVSSLLKFNDTKSQSSS